MWKDCSFLEDINFTTIKLQATPKVNNDYHYTKHVIKEEGPNSEVKVDDQPMEIDRAFYENKLC